jgi:hypothetical protein
MKSSVAKRFGSGGGWTGADVAIDGNGKLVVPADALRLRWRLWAGPAVADPDGKLAPGALQRACTAAEWFDDVRGGMAEGDCRKVLGLRIGPAAAMDGDAWSAMTGCCFCWFCDGRLKCSIGTVKGSDRRKCRARPRAVSKGTLGLVVRRWGCVFRAGACDDMRLNTFREWSEKSLG